MALLIKQEVKITFILHAFIHLQKIISKVGNALDLASLYSILNVL